MKTIERGIPFLPKIENDLTRRKFLVAAGLITLAPACGSDGENGEESSAETREVRHSLGESEVPVEPRRVIAVDPYVTLPTALLLGAPVVGSSLLPFGEDPFPVFVEEDTEGIEDVGWLTPDIETVAALDPDLIIGYETFLEAYDQFRQIAPTVGIESFGDEWRASVRKVARVLGREEAVEEEFGRFDGRLEEFKSEMGGRLGGFTVSLVNVRALNDIRINTPGFPSGQVVLEEAGVRRPASERPVPDTSEINLTIETLPEIGGDVIFYFVGSSGTNPEEAAEQAERIRSNPLWGQLEAVQNDRAYEVNPEWWFNAGSLQAANLILDDLFEHLVENG